MPDKDKISEELSNQLRPYLRRVFLRIHPDKFRDSPEEASVNKLAFQQLTQCLENLEANVFTSNPASLFTCFLREAENIRLVQGAQVETFRENLFKLTIQVIRESNVPPNILLLLRVLEAFNLEVPSGFTMFIRESQPQVCSETLDDFVEKHGGLVEARLLQSTFFSSMETRRHMPTTSAKIFGLRRQLESKMHLYLKVECPNEETVYDQLLRLKRLLETNELIGRKVKGYRLSLKASECCFVNPESGVVTLGTSSSSEEWEKTLMSSESQEFWELDNRIRKLERVVERVLKFRRVFCSNEILWDRRYLAKYDKFLSCVADGSFFRSNFCASYENFFDSIKFENLTLILNMESEYTSIPDMKVYLRLSDCLSQMATSLLQQLELLLNTSIERQKILDHMERVKTRLELVFIDFDHSVPVGERLKCLRRLDEISVRAKQYFKGLHLLISDKYEISNLTGRISIPYFFECRELDKFLCYK
jgi:hypothetical protein